MSIRLSEVEVSVCDFNVCCDDAAFSISSIVIGIALGSVLANCLDSNLSSVAGFPSAFTNLCCGPLCTGPFERELNAEFSRCCLISGVLVRPS